MRLAVCLIFAAVAAHADEWNKTWNVSEGAEIRADVGDGSIHMHPGSSNKIEAHVTTIGWRISPGEVTITEHQTGNKVEIDLHIPKGPHFQFGRRSVDVDLRVPAHILATVRSGDGGLHLEGLRGAFNLTTGDGGIDATEIEGSVTAHTGDGHIKVSGRLDTLDVTTGDGSIEVDVAENSRMKSSWRAHTGDGHVTLRLPTNFQATLDAHTGDGSVDVGNIPITLEGGVRKSDLRGKMNGGGEVLSIRTGDGGITIQHL